MCYYENVIRHIFQVHITAGFVSFLDFLTSILAGVVIFTILGQLKLEAGLDNIGEVVKGGVGLAFIAYPEALSRLPVPQLWSFIFFLMLYLLGLDSQMATLETALTCIYDGFPRTKRYKPLVVFIICFSCFLMSLPCVSTSGLYVFQIMDDYGGGMTVMWIAIAELVLIAWVYGARRLADDLNFMLGTNSKIILPVLWSLVPILLATILGFSLSSFQPPYTRDALGDILYPSWVHGIGICLILMVVLQIPFWGLVVCIYYHLSPDLRLRDVFRPTPDWGPGDKEAMKRYKAEINALK